MCFSKRPVRYTYLSVSWEKKARKSPREKRQNFLYVSNSLSTLSVFCFRCEFLFLKASLLDLFIKRLCVCVCVCDSFYYLLRVCLPRVHSFYFLLVNLFTRDKKRPTSPSTVLFLLFFIMISFASGCLCSFFRSLSICVCEWMFVVCAYYYH